MNNFHVIHILQNTIYIHNYNSQLHIAWAAHRDMYMDISFM